MVWSRKILVISIVVYGVLGSAQEVYPDVNQAVEDLFPEIMSERALVPLPGGPVRRYTTGLSPQEVISRVQEAYAQRRKLRGGVIVSGYANGTQGGFSFTLKKFHGNVLGTLRLKTSREGAVLEFTPAVKTSRYLPFRVWTPEPKTYYYPLGK